MSLDKKKPRSQSRPFKLRNRNRLANLRQKPRMTSMAATYGPQGASAATRLIFLVVSSALCASVVSSPSVGLLWPVPEERRQGEPLQLEPAPEQQEKLYLSELSVLLEHAAMCQRKGELHRALELYETALGHEPQNSILLQGIGKLYLEIGDAETALRCFLGVQRQHRNDGANPDEDELLHLLALAYDHTNDYAAAENIYRSVSERGRSAAFHFDFGVTLARLGKIVEAGAEYDRALEMEPTLAHARLNIAALHHQYGDVNESIPHYLHVISLASAPDDIKLMAMGNVGVAYETTNDVVSAMSWYNRALTVLPSVHANDPFAQETQRLSLLTHVARAKRSACFWRGAEQEFYELWEMVSKMQLALGVPYIFSPFDSLMYELSPRERKALAMQYSKRYAVGNVGRNSRRGSSEEKLHLVPDDYQHESRLHVGYLSYDYADHPTTHLMEGVFSTADRRTTKLVAFGYGRDDSSAFRQRVTKCVDKFVDLSAASFEQSVESIRSEKIHIIMDAQGHTRGGRMEIVAMRPSPIVVNYLVFPGTSGASFVDYVIVDRYVAPPAELASAFTEKLVLLPYSYQVNYYKSVLASEATVASRASLWRKDGVYTTQHGAFVFVNFNKIDKLEVSVFSMWLSILRRVPGSTLLLLDPAKRNHGDSTGGEDVTSRESKRNLWREARAQGVSSERIHFAARVPKAQHLQRHRRGGLFLDTFIYGAHSTATDALYAGVPVLTLAGDSFASRVGVSLLENLGLPGLVAYSRKEYEELAVYLATTPAVLSRLQGRLRNEEAKYAQPLFDTTLHTRGLEASQRLMYDIYVLSNRTFHLVV